MKLPMTSGTHKSYKPGQLITICKNIFRIVKNKSSFTDCYKIGRASCRERV